MQIDRRGLIAGSVVSAAALATQAIAAPVTAQGLQGIDAAQFGLHPGAPDDQSAKLQRAIDRAARTRAPLWLAPGVYRAGGLKLSAGTQLIGVRGATRLVLTRGTSLLSAQGAETITLQGLVLEGGGISLPQRQGLVQLADIKSIRIVDCTIGNAGGNALMLAQCDGDISRNSIVDAADNAIFSTDARGLIIVGNHIRGSGNTGIAVWQSEKRHDGSLIADNTIEDTKARGGGDGQNGNAIAVFRAGDVIVRNNHIRNAAFSAVRGNSAANIQILGNNCIDCDDVALYSEFDFEGCVMADNVVDGAGNGISVTNFDFRHGRLATVHGNVLRNLKPRAAGATLEDFGRGMLVQGDTAVNGNVIERAASVGIRAGWGPYLRNVAITGNVLRQCAVGVEVSVVKGAEQALIADNIFDGVPGGAVVGMEWVKPVTGDLTKDGAAAYPQLTIANNRVR